jgi:hypothetical protein
MKKIFILFSIICLILILMCCKSSSSKSFNQCKVQSLSLINAEDNKELNGKIIKEYLPIPQKITLSFSELPTRKVMFLTNFAPEDCANSLKGEVNFVGDHKADLSKTEKPLTLFGFAKTDIFGKVNYVSGSLDLGLRKYELIPQYFKDSKIQEGEKLQFELEVIEK